MATIRQITSLAQMRMHLSAVYQSQPQIEIQYARTTIGAARIIYDVRRADELLIRATTPVLPKGGVLRLKYFLHGFECAFESQILTMRSIANAGAIIRISRPNTISAINRRRFLRYHPAAQQSINITLELPRSAPATYPVQDISACGFSLLLPFETDFSAFKKEVSCTIELPGSGLIRSGIALKNICKLRQGIRVGAQIISLSEMDRKRLVDFTVEQALKTRYASMRSQKRQPPTLCLIHDNENNRDLLAYLEQPYRLIRHNVRDDWKPLATFSPDVLLFDLDSINPSALLSNVRGLDSLKQAPAIVIAGEQKIDGVTGDATVLSHFKDPAALIVAVEQAIPSEKEPAETSGGPDAAVMIPKKSQPTIFILDLKNNVGQTVIDAIERQHFAVVVRNNERNILDIIREIDPVLIGISADLDTALDNLLRMLKMNKHTKSRPVVLLTGDIEKNQDALNLLRSARVTVFPTGVDPEALARQMAITFLRSKRDMIETS